MTGSPAAARPRPRRRPLARRMVAALRLEPHGRSAALLRRRRAHRAQGRDPRRLRSQALVVEGVRRHPRDDLARRLQPLAPAGPQRLLPAARLGLLRRVRQIHHLHHARRAVEPPRDFRRRLGQDGIAASRTPRTTARPSRCFSSARKGQEKTVHHLATPITGRKIRFTNVEQEEPIGELVAYNVTAGREPAGSAKLAYRLASACAHRRRVSTDLVRSSTAASPRTNGRCWSREPVAFAAPARRVRRQCRVGTLPLVHVLDSRHVGQARRRPRRHCHRPAGAQGETDARRIVPAQHPGEGSALADAQHARLHVSA